MAKLLMWIVLGVLSLLAWKTVAGRVHRLRRDDRNRPPTDRAAGAEAAPDESMLRCAQCGVHFPASEAIAGDGMAFCSAAHRDAHRAH